jgi:hypothetical protein
MIKKSVTAKDICSLLNELLEKDSSFVKNLMEVHVPCNEDIANHPTVQVRGYNEYPNVHTCGIMGLINGILGIREDGFGALCYEIDEAGNIVEFKETPTEGGKSESIEESKNIDKS